MKTNKYILSTDICAFAFIYIKVKFEYKISELFSELLNRY